MLPYKKAVCAVTAGKRNDHRRTVRRNIVIIGRFVVLDHLKLHPPLRLGRHSHIALTHLREIDFCTVIPLCKFGMKNGIRKCRRLIWVKILLLVLLLSGLCALSVRSALICLSVLSPRYAVPAAANSQQQNQYRQKTQVRVTPHSFATTSLPSENCIYHTPFSPDCQDLHSFAPECLRKIRSRNAARAAGKIVPSAPY